MTDIEQVNPHEHEASPEIVGDDARKFIVTAIASEVLSSNDTTYLLVTDWLETGESTEDKLAYKKYTDGTTQILRIRKVTTETGRKSQKDPLSQDEYAKLLQNSLLRVEKIRHELAFTQDGLDFSLKYDEFQGADLRILEVEADTEDERMAFDPVTFPGELKEVTGDIRYYGYRVAGVFES